MCETCNKMNAITAQLSDGDKTVYNGMQLFSFWMGSRMPDQMSEREAAIRTLYVRNTKLVRDEILNVLKDVVGHNVAMVTGEPPTSAYILPVHLENLVVALVGLHANGVITGVYGIVPVGMQAELIALKELS